MKSAKRIVVLGLDNSHPFIDSANLLALDPGIEFVLVDPACDEKRDRFLKEFPGSELVINLDLALRDSPDGVLVTLRPSSLLTALPELVASNVPAFVNKQGIATRQQLDAALSVLNTHSHRIMTSSVLRFAPDIREMDVDLTGLKSVHVLIGHGVEHWKLPDNQWQADHREGGAVVGSLSYHGFDLLDEIVGANFLVDDCVVDWAVNHESTHGNRVLISGHWPHGPTGTIQLDTTVAGEKYEVNLTYESREAHIVIDRSRRDGFGYRGAMRAFLSHIAGESTVKWERSLPLIENAVTAHSLAYSEPSTIPNGTKRSGDQK